MNKQAAISAAKELSESWSEIFHVIELAPTEYEVISDTCLYESESDRVVASYNNGEPVWFLIADETLFDFDE